MTPEVALGIALDLAREPGLEMPIAAVVLDPRGEVIGRGVNRREADSDPTAHAEILALREAGRVVGDWRLTGCTLAVTLEPCTMCAGAAVLARIQRLVFGAFDDKAGAVGGLWDVVRDPRLNHSIEVVGGVRQDQCAQLLSTFFEERR
ncbi:MAG: nucleoside deaminase [Actinobacteria bacterium]|nr:MAG: nucleoside deaminase [Actinomycetota bacterium]